MKNSGKNAAAPDLKTPILKPYCYTERRELYTILSVNATPKMRFIKMEFRDRLIELQGTRTQKEFAKHLEIPLNTYTNWLLHSRRPTMDAIISICTKMNVSADWLLCLSNDKYEISTHPERCRESEWMRRAMIAEKKLEKINGALSHALKGFQELQEAVK